MSAATQSESSPAPPGAVKTEPVRANLFRQSAADGRHKLLGSRCRETGEVFWPAEVMNPSTHKAGTMDPAEIDGSGKLVSFTVVARGLPGFVSPYMLGVVALDAGPTLMAQIDGDASKPPHLNQRVELVIGTIKTEKDGTAIVGPRFRPVGS